MLYHSLLSTLVIPFLSYNVVAKPLKRYEAGPVMPYNFPDPCIIKTGGWWYSFATNNGNNLQNVQIARSQDFYTWSLVMNGEGTGQMDALPNPPNWVNMTAQDIWAPDVNELDDGTFVMYYSARTTANFQLHCVGAATSNNILGPYTPQVDALFCPLAQGGAIDAAGFKDWEKKGGNWGGNDGWGWSWHEGHNSWRDREWGHGGKGGTRWVTYKVDGNAIGHGGICGNTVAPIVPTPIILQQVAADGITPIGQGYTILDNNGLQDEGLVEAPSLIKTASGEYILFFSAHCYSSATYDVEYATAENLMGPYTRRGALFELGTYGLNGPGGADVLWDGRHMVFHANEGNNGFNGVRQMHIAILDINGVTVTA